VLAAIDIDLSGGLTLGDLIVGVGTLALAWFTWRLASATYSLDERNAARERERRERQVRGIARLIDGELELVQNSVERAIGGGAWWRFFPIPHGAWDRDGALIAETLQHVEALEVINTFARLATWESGLAELQQKEDPVPIEPESSRHGILSDLVKQVGRARVDLMPLAYPKEPPSPRSQFTERRI
jgi:hypothetical protein